MTASVRSMRPRSARLAVWVRYTRPTPSWAPTPGCAATCRTARRSSGVRVQSTAAAPATDVSGGGDKGSGGGQGLGGGGGGGGDGFSGDSENGSEDDGGGFGWQGWKDRVAFDPEFPFKVFVEQVSHGTYHCTQVVHPPAATLCMSAAVRS